MAQYALCFPLPLPGFPFCLGLLLDPKFLLLSQPFALGSRLLLLAKLATLSLLFLTLLDLAEDRSLYFGLLRHQRRAM